MRKISKTHLVLLFLALLALHRLAWGLWDWGGAVIFSALLLCAILTGIVGLYASFARYGAHDTEAAARQHTLRHMQALAYLHTSLSLRHPLPFLGGMAVLPDFAECLAGLIRELRPNHILELGSGSSTIIAGYVLQELAAGSLLSLDHDEHWANHTRANLALHGVQERVRLEVAPLREINIAGERLQWYGYDRLAEFGPIDLLVVDGPPEWTGKMARYPALPVLMPFLSERAVILVDDFRREGEAEMVRLWMRDFPGFSYEKLDFEKGAAILRRAARA